MQLSVVIPVHNEAAQLAETIASVSAAIHETDCFLEAEIVVADDGSTDGTSQAAASAATTVPVRAVRLPVNRGRFLARRHGLEAATGDDVLFVDAGVTIEPGSLRYVERERRADPDALVWNAHTVMATDGRPAAVFWEVVQDIAFAAYQADPRRTSFGAEEFDRFPKGTTCFLAPRTVLLEASDAFTSVYDDLRHSSDDTALIRWIAERMPINIAPGFACVYRPRTSIRAFFRHAIGRGVRFPDTFRDPRSRFFWPMVAFYPVSAALLVASLRRPVVAGGAAVAVAGSAAAVAAAHGRARHEIAAVAALGPVYAAGHGIGMWKGAAMIVARRFRLDA